MDGRTGRSSGDRAGPAAALARSRTGSYRVARMATTDASAAPGGSGTGRRYAVSPVLGGIELLTARYTRHAFPPHAQDDWVLGFVEAGTVTIAAEGRELTLRPGRLLLIAPGVIHEAHAASSTPWDYRAVYLTAAQWAAVAGVEAARDAAGAHVLAAEEATGELQALHARLEGAAAGGAAEAAADVPDVLSRVRALLGLVALACAAGPHAAARELSVPARLERVRLHLERTTDRPVTLDELAAMVGMSRFRLVRLFSQAYGVPPYAYALQHRLLEARRLLAAGVGIAEAALRLGFADQSHLTRWFLRAVGVTPGEFVRARARGAARRR